MGSARSATQLHTRATAASPWPGPGNLDVRPRITRPTRMNYAVSARSVANWPQCHRRDAKNAQNQRVPTPLLAHGIVGFRGRMEPAHAAEPETSSFAISASARRPADSNYNFITHSHLSFVSISFALAAPLPRILFCRPAATQHRQPHVAPGGRGRRGTGADENRNVAYDFQLKY